MLINKNSVTFDISLLSLGIPLPSLNMPCLAVSLSVYFMLSNVSHSTIWVISWLKAVSHEIFLFTAVLISRTNVHICPDGSYGLIKLGKKNGFSYAYTHDCYDHYSSNTMFASLHILLHTYLSSQALLATQCMSLSLLLSQIRQSLLTHHMK